MSTDTPDLSLILDDLYIGNLAAAKSLHEYPELGITHILSVCPEYPEAEEARKGATISAIASRPSAQHPTHRCISIEDSEFEDILTHLPAAVAFIRDALEPRQTIPGDDDGQQTSAEKRNIKQVAELRAHNSCTRSAQKHKVLVHCVMGISRSTTVVCAYLMATRQLSFPAALMFIRKRRPRVHPNYGFRRQLQIFGECGYFKNYPAPVQTHPAFTAWQRKKRREVCRYLSRIEDAIEIKLDNEDEPQLAIADDFPTDPLEASSLLSEVGATHFLSISPASLPSLSSAPSSTTSSRRPSGPSPILSSAWSSGLSPDSTVSSPLSSRSSSFSSRFSPLISGPSTAATSVLSLPSVLPPSKLRTEASSSESDSEDDTSSDPSYLELAGVEHHHLAIPDSDSSSLLFHLDEAASFINRSLNDADTSSSSESDVDLNLNIEDKKFIQRKHVLIHCTTENRACAVVCAYLMRYKGLTPRQAYDVLEKALPLFNLTRSFANLLELFHDCEYNPTVDHPLVHKWLSGTLRSVLPSSSLSSFSSTTASLSAKSVGVRPSATTHWNVESDTEGDAESMSLRRKLGTPMRCGSFSTNYSHANTNSNTGQGQGQKMSLTATSNAGRYPHPSSATEGMDLEGLLQRFQGVGDPNFAFDVEAFRGAICAAAGGNAKSKK